MNSDCILSDMTILFVVVIPVILAVILIWETSRHD